MPIMLLARYWSQILLALAVVWAFFYGQHIENLSWKAAQADAIEKQHAAVKVIEAQNQALKDKADADYLKSRSDVDAAYTRGIHAGKLRDKGGQCVGVPQTPTAADNPADGAASCELSDATTANIRQLARDADLAAIYAQAGHQYAVGR